LTGFKTEIETLKFEYPGHLKATGLRLYNPSGFTKAVFAEAPFVEIESNLIELIREEKLHFYNLKLTISEIHIEKNNEGISNVGLLRSVGRDDDEEDSIRKEDKRFFYLDRLELTLRRVTYEDRYSRIPKNFSVDMEMRNRIFTGIPSGQELINLILRKIIRDTPFGRVIGLAEVIPAPVREVMLSSGGVLTQTTEIVADNATRIVKKMKPVMKEATEGMVKGAVVEAGSTLEEAAKTTKEKISELVGKVSS
jgi:hypothetical protein